MLVDEKAVNSDVGLGLKDFLAPKPAEASPVEKPDAKVEVKSDEKPVVEVKSTTPVETKVETPVEAVKAKKSDKSDKSDVKVEPAAAPNWDDETNPWKKKATDFDQRYRDTHRNWNELNQRNQALEHQLKVLGKKFDGTYDPRVDEPPPIDPQVLRQQGTIEGKAAASYAGAIRTHGIDIVTQALEKYAELFKNDRHLQERILMSDDPVQGAMDAVAGNEFFAKYGNNPAAIMAKIRAETEAELAPKIREAESKRVMDELAAKKGEPKGIGNVQGASGATDKQVGRDNAGRSKGLTEIFGR